MSSSRCRNHKLKHSSPLSSSPRSEAFQPFQLLAPIPTTGRRRPATRWLRRRRQSPRRYLLRRRYSSPTSSWRRSPNASPRPPIPPSPPPPAPSPPMPSRRPPTSRYRSSRPPDAGNLETPVPRRPRPRDGGSGSDEQGGVVVEHANNVTTVLAVCDPSYRRYVLLPPIPYDLTDFGELGRPVDFEPFLAPAGEEQEAEETSFRVVARAQCHNKLVAFVFSSRTGQWRGVELHGWSALDTGVCSLLGAGVLCWPFYTRGCF